MCATSESYLVSSLRNSTTIPLPKTHKLSIEGDFIIDTAGGGCSRACGPAKATSKTSAGGAENDSERVRPISSFSRMGSTVGGIVRASCVSGSSRQAVFSTFTYSSDDADLQETKRDAALLARRLKRTYPALEYLLVLEPHDKGDWHTHAILLLPEGIDASSASEVILGAWSHGRANVETVTDANGLADYLSPFSPKKRARWHFYPPGVRTYFASAGMPRPTVVRGLSEAEAREMVRSLGGQYLDERKFGPPGEDMGRKVIYRIAEVPPPRGTSIN